jgi:hypothetical protein
LGKTWQIRAAHILVFRKQRERIERIPMAVLFFLLSLLLHLGLPYQMVLPIFRAVIPP